MNDTIDAPSEQAQAIGRYTGPGAGEIITIAQRDLSMEESTYVGMSTQPVSAEQADILNRDLPDEDIDIRPDGAIFMSHARLRRRLNEAFKPGGWALRRLTPVQASEATDKQNKVDLILSAEYALYAEGRFLSAARGEQKYQDNGEMTYGDAVEGLKSNALSRCCKDLGIALDLWDRNFADKWRQTHCVKVWREKGGSRPQWRRFDALPFYDETGIAKDSPNQERYVEPIGGRTRSQQAQPEQRRQDAQPQRPTQQHQQQEPRDRVPGEDDDPGELSDRDARLEAARQDAPRSPGTGRKISDPQCKRLFMKATRDGGMSKDQYRDFIRRWGYDRDTDVLMADYDKMVDEAMAGGR